MDGGDLNEVWLQNVKEEELELKQTIKALYNEKMTDEEIKVTDDSAARVAAVKAKHNECMAVTPNADFKGFI